MVNTREIAEEYRLSHWAEVMRERRESGLTIKAYCRRIGICGNTYFYWQRKLREAACEELAARVQKGAAVAGEHALVPKGWAACTTAEDTTGEPTVEGTAAEGSTTTNEIIAKGRSLAVEIGKYRVLVEADSDPDLLAKVCRTLVTLC